MGESVSLWPSMSDRLQLNCIHISCCCLFLPDWFSKIGVSRFSETSVNIYRPQSNLSEDINLQTYIFLVIPLDVSFTWNWSTISYIVIFDNFGTGIGTWHNILHIGFQVLIGITARITTLCVVTPCSLVEFHDISQERFASIFRINELAKHETNNKQA
jgi:hypothetical protein